MNKKKICLLSIYLSWALLFFAAPVSGEENGAFKTREDTELWQAISIDIKPVEKLKVELESQTRYYNNVMSLKSTFSEIGIGYRLNRLTGFSVHYRLTARGTGIRHRFDADMQLNFKAGEYSISNRSRIQREYIENVRSIYWFRNRLKIKLCKSRNLLPFVAGEMFRPLATEPDDRREYRLTLGTDWKMKKRITARFFYHHHKVKKKNSSETIRIIGLKFNYSIK